MSQSRSYAYRAFLSYSHRDHDAGEKLHKSLENFRIPWGIAGKSGTYGTIPGKLRPIFRDRFDLEAGHSLGEQVASALDQSETLIVVCSPASAKSKYVESEIISFKQLGRGDRIYPIIVAGEPGDPENECFPKALCFKVAADGTLTEEREEPIAADARSQGDGEELARLKLVAGLLGVDLDELRRRQREDERTWRRIWAGIAGTMAVLAVASAVLWRTAEFERNAKSIALEKTERLSAAILDRTSSLVSRSVASTDEFGVPVRVGIGILKEADGIFADMDRIGVESKQLGIGRARMLLSFADSLARLGKVAEQKEKSDSALKVANTLLAEAPDDPELLHLKADALLRSGHVSSARYEINQALGYFHEALDIREKALGGGASDNPRYLQAYATLLKDIAVAHNRSSEPREALRLAQEAVSVAAKLASMQGQDFEAADTRAAATIVVADMQRQLGKRKDALKTVADGIQDVDQMLAFAADSVPWQRRKGHLLLIKGDVERADGNIPKALVTYGQSFEVRNRLHEADPQNATLAVEAGYARLKVGEVLTNLGRLDEAQREFEEALALHEAVISLNPEHRLAARTSIDVLDGLGEVYRQKKEFDKMLEVAKRKLEVATRIYETDRDNRDAQRAVARVMISMGDAYHALKEEDRAIESYLEAERDMQRLKEPSAGDERELATALENLSGALFDKQRPEEATNVMERALEVRRSHAEMANATVGARQRYCFTMEKLADMKLERGDNEGARALLGRSIAIREPLIDAETGSETYRQLALAYDQLARAEIGLKSAKPALAALTKALPIREKLLLERAADGQRQRNLAYTLKLRGEAEVMEGDCTASETLGRAATQLDAALGSDPSNERWLKLKEDIAALKATAPACAAPPAPAAAAITEALNPEGEAGPPVVMPPEAASQTTEAEPAGPAQPAQDTPSAPRPTQP